MKEEIKKENYLRIHSLGHINLTDSKNNMILLENQKAYELFFYLFHHSNQIVTKDQIIEDLFPQTSQTSADGSFHTILYQMRKKFNAIGIKDVIGYKGGIYYLNIEVQSDIKQLESLLELTPNEERIHQLLSLYKGKYFEGFSYRWAQQYGKIIHTKCIKWMKDALHLETLSKDILNQLLILFEEDYLTDLSLLEKLVVNLDRQKEYVQIKALLLNTQKYWEHYNVLFPLDFKKSYDEIYIRK